MTEKPALALENMVTLLPNSSTYEGPTDFNSSVRTSGLPANAEVEMRCFIDPQLAFFTAASAGGAIVILLITTIVLACTVTRLKRHRYRVPRSSRSDTNLLRTDYWPSERPEEGVTGPCESSVLLEEVKADCDDDEDADGPSSDNKNTATEAHSLPPNTHSSASRETCIDPTKLENMPLVV